MRDIKIHEEKESNPWISIVFIVTLITAVYSYFMSHPHLIKDIPGIDHFADKTYEKSNEQKRRDYNMNKEDKKTQPQKEHAIISQADKDALRMLLEAVK